MSIPRNLSFLAEGASSTGVLGTANGGTGNTVGAASSVALTAGSGSTNYLVYASSATGNAVEYTSTGLTYNATNNAVTGGISGGSF